MSNRTLQKISAALPPPVVEWLNVESKACGMTRNSFLIMKLMLCRETQHGERLRRVETRVAQLEHKVNSGL
jgi:hypothetical protein